MRSLQIGGIYPPQFSSLIITLRGSDRFFAPDVAFRNLAEPVGLDVEGPVHQIIDMFTGYSPRDLHELTFREMLLCFGKRRVGDLFVHC